MRRSKTLTAFLTIALFGALAFVPSGCSNNSGSTSSPDIGYNASNYDPYPPEMPSGLEVVKFDSEGVKLHWTSNTDSDLAGYKVYIYEPSPYSDNSYRCLNSSQLLSTGQNWYVYQADMEEGFTYFKIVAVDTSGNQSLTQAPLEFSYENAANSSDSSREKSGNADRESLPEAATSPDNAPKEQNEEDWDDGESQQ